MASTDSTGSHVHFNGIIISVHGFHTFCENMSKYWLVFDVKRGEEVRMIGGMRKGESLGSRMRARQSLCYVQFEVKWT